VLIWSLQIVNSYSLNWIFLDLAEEAEQIIPQDAQGCGAYLGVEGRALVLAELQELLELLEAHLNGPAVGILPDDGGCMKMGIGREESHPLGLLLLASPLDIILFWLAVVSGKKRPPFNMPHIKWSLLEGDEVILPGLGVMLANGHTPGLQGLIVDLPKSGFYLLGADSAYLTENIAENLPPGSSWNPILAQYSVKRFKTLAAMLGARYFPGHDYDFFTKEVKIAEIYI